MFEIEMDDHQGYERSGESNYFNDIKSKFVFNIDTIIKCQMFLVSGYIFTYDNSHFTAVRRNYYNNTAV